MLRYKQFIDLNKNKTLYKIFTSKNDANKTFKSPKCEHQIFTGYDIGLMLNKTVIEYIGEIIPNENAMYLIDDDDSIKTDVIDVTSIFTLKEMISRKSEDNAYVFGIHIHDLYAKYFPEECWNFNLECCKNYGNVRQITPSRIGFSTFI